MSYLSDHVRGRPDKQTWSCGRKVRYRTWSAADRIRRRMLRKGSSSGGGDGDHLVVYRCVYCQGFHLGNE